MGAQADLFDAQLRHHIDVQRLVGSDVARILRLLKKSDADLVKLLEERVDPGDFTSRRFRSLLSDIRELRAALMKEARSANRQSLLDLADVEQGAGRKMFERVIPVRLDYAVAETSRLVQLIDNQPFAAGTNRARLLGDWWDDLTAADSRRITDALQYSALRSETVQQATTRVAQAAKMTRVNAEAVVRTAANHAANGAREEFFKANSSVIAYLMWSSTLDGRTTEVCMARDGANAPLDSDKWDGVPEPHLETPYERPPAHPQCRSLMIALLSAMGIAQLMPDRAFVRDTRTRKWRERDFRAEASAKTEGWSTMSDRQRTAVVRDIRQRWAADAIGQVPARTTYAEWLRAQPAEFQNDVLGPARADLFRGGMPLTKFVDRAGGGLTLKQIRERE